MLLRHVVPEQAVRIPAGDTSLTSALGDNIRIQRNLDDIFRYNFDEKPKLKVLPKDSTLFVGLRIGVLGLRLGLGIWTQTCQH